MYRRALILLLFLLGGALIAIGALQSLAGNCRRIERDAAIALKSLDLCAQNIGCRFDYRDLVTVVHQRRAAMRCESARRDAE